MCFHVRDNNLKSRLLNWSTYRHFVNPDTDIPSWYLETMWILTTSIYMPILGEGIVDSPRVDLLFNSYKTWSILSFMAVKPNLMTTSNGARLLAIISSTSIDLGYR